MTYEAGGNGGALDIDPTDAEMMGRCIELARAGAARGELPIGSLIARRGQIIAERSNARSAPGENDGKNAFSIA